MLPIKSNDQPAFKLEGSTDESPEAELWIALDNNGFPTSISGSNIVNRSVRICAVPWRSQRADQDCPEHTPSNYISSHEIESHPARHSRNIPDACCL